MLPAVRVRSVVTPVTVMVPGSLSKGITSSFSSENSIAATSEVNSISEVIPLPVAVKQISKRTSPSGRSIGVKLFSNQLTVINPALGVPILAASEKPGKLEVRLVMSSSVSTLGL